MNTEKRRNEIKLILEQAQEPITASTLAEKFSVSRQIIVGDVALLRASGLPVTATPKGYVLDHTTEFKGYPFVGIVACRHDYDQMKQELYTVVDFGGTVIDVIVEHSIYGQLSGILEISSRYDADLFLEKVNGNTKPLSNITGGIHIHHIGCKNKDTFDIIKNKLDNISITL